MASTKLVVEDDADSCELLCTLLAMEGYATIAADSGESALAIAESGDADLVLLDLMLPDRDGWDITRIMRSDPTLSHIPIIMLTARVNDTDKIVGLEMGADDYVTKPYNPREVVARVRARLRVQQSGGVSHSEKVLLVGSLQLDTGRREFKVDDREVKLTATEFEILRALMEQAGFVLTRGELIRRALGSKFDGVDRTLDSHIRNLRQKVEPDPKHPKYIKTVYGVGYRLEGGEDG